MVDESQSPITRKHTSKSGFGDVEGGIHHSNIAGRDINIIKILPMRPAAGELERDLTACHTSIVHAPGEAQLADQLREPIRDAGYPVVYYGSLLEGESIEADAARILDAGGPVVLCASVKALGTGWAHRVIQVTQRYQKAQIFLVQMDEQAYVPMLTPDRPVPAYWRDPVQATQELVAALKRAYPRFSESEDFVRQHDMEEKYQKRVLESCDIVDLANLPEADRYIATRKLELRRLYVALRVRLENPSDDEIGKRACKTTNRRDENYQLDWTGNSAQHQDCDKFSIGDVLSGMRQLVVLGDPGAGKTTMVRWLATAYLLRLKEDPDWRAVPGAASLPDEDWLPIVVRCRDLHPSRLDNLYDVLNHNLRKSQFSGSEVSHLVTVLKNKLINGHALLLFDGLDEIPDLALRARFCYQIEQFHLAYPNVPIIVTSRIVGYRETGHRIGRGFQHVTLAELTKEDKDDFARRWCSVTEIAERAALTATELIRDIHSSDRIEHLTGNPLLLTTLALVRRKVGKLPQRRADLYWEAVQVLLNWRSAVDEPIDYREAIPQLNFVAYAMCNRGLQQLREDEIIDLLVLMREQYPQIYTLHRHTPEDFLRLLERRTGILIEAGRIRHLGRSVRFFEFRHLTFQEYLAGLALVDGKFPNRDPMLTLAENVALLAGRTSKVNQHLSVEQDTVVAESWREALRICVASCRDDDVDAVLRAILSVPKGEDGLTTARPRAVLAALCLADEPNASEVVVRGVLQEFAKQIGPSDGATFERTSADAAACALVASRWAELLSTSLLEEYFRREASDRVTNQANIGGLCALVAAASAPEDKCALSQWLAKQASVIMSGNELGAIKAALAVMELSFRKRAEPIAELVDGLLSMVEQSAAEAHAAAWALYWLNGGSSGEDSRAWQPSTTETERLSAIVGNLAPDAGAVSFLVPILGRECGPRAMNLLIARLEDEDSQVRKAAAEALGRIGDVRAVEPLISRMHDRDRDVQKVSVQMLGWLGDFGAVKPLIAELRNKDSEIRNLAAEALVQIEDSRVVEVLVDQSRLEDDQARQAVVEVLGKIGDAQAVGSLIEALMDANGDVRRAAAKALGQIGDAQAVEPLVAMLDDRDLSVRRAVVEVLGEIGNVGLLEPSNAQLSVGDDKVRQAKAEALRESRSQE